MIDIKDLPNGWMGTTYGDVYLSASNGTGGKQNKDGIGIPVSRIETIASENIDYTRIGYLADSDESKATRHELVAGDILFSHINSPIHLGKTAIFDGEKTLYHGINLLRIIVDRKLILPEIFNYHCKYMRALGIFSLNAQHAVNQSSLNQKKLGAFSISLPPLAEQKVIANKLDTLLAQVETTKARLDRIPDILKRFRQSVLAAAVSGRFTSNKQVYRTVTLDSLCNSNSTITYGVIKLGKDVHDGVPCLRTSNVRWLNIEAGNVKKIAHELSNSYSRTVLKGGEVLVNVRGTLGGVATVPINMAGWNVSREIAVVPLDHKLADTQFLALWIASERSQQWLAKVSKGVAYVVITLKNLRNLPVELPSTLKEQTEIVRRVEELFALADAIEQKAQAATERVNKLTQSILAKAFRGELTADWRAANPDLISGENSAEALLAKIKAEREALKPKRKTRAKKVAG